MLDELKSSLGIIPRHVANPKQKYVVSYIGTWPKEEAQKIRNNLTSHGFRVRTRGRGSRVAGKYKFKFTLTDKEITPNKFYSDLPIKHAVNLALYVDNRFKGSLKLQLLRWVLEYIRDIKSTYYRTQAINSIIENINKAIKGETNWW